ncbi:MarR family winged helix-turn-helix transcriptional regulator [Sediminibacterium goheungense]|uniref:DNA-binding MarR family transcriptional regulator n=1 Tax=Sediminibacterium goheungense TaxID=1086393 RepID=A0A4R6IVR5_9BACT|nr:MarR family winged helix-turn-helix transcriptional regulator [Sediminibacterium goheungense]TDO26773.1 DNA-binding MarR family transcriptional regulator [Sediminibacterium goheungense]
MKTTDSRYHQCLYFTSNALARKIEKLAIENWKQVDLSPSHGYVLMAVLEEPGVQPGRLSDEMQLTPSTITRLLEKLEEKKLVIRTTEGKITNVYPTPKAKELFPQLKKCVTAFYQQYASIIGHKESNQLVKTLGAIADQL